MLDLDVTRLSTLPSAPTPRPRPPAKALLSPSELSTGDDESFAMLGPPLDSSSFSCRQSVVASTSSISSPCFSMSLE